MGVATSEPSLLYWDIAIFLFLEAVSLGGTPKQPFRPSSDKVMPSQGLLKLDFVVVLGIHTSYANVK